MRKRGAVFSPEVVYRKDCAHAAIDVLEGLILAHHEEPGYLEAIYWFKSDKIDMVAHFTCGRSVTLGKQQ